MRKILLSCLLGAISSLVWAQASFTLNCSTAAHTGTLTAEATASNVSSTIFYTSNIASVYVAQSIASTGVTGLTASLPAGSIINGSGKLTYTITGTPVSKGIANFPISIGGQACTLSRTVNPKTGSIAAISCLTANQAGTLAVGAVCSGVSITLGYTGGDGGAYNVQTISSTGVTGLTANLPAGNFASGSGNLTYSITGTPASVGTARFSLTVGGQTCVLNRLVNPALVGGLNCSNAINSGTLAQGVAAAGVGSGITYTGGNGGAYERQVVNSTGVTGLTATLAAGNLSVGTGTLNYSITGTPATAGTASFSLNLGGQICTLNRTVLPPASLTELQCAGIENSGSIFQGRVANLSYTLLPYTGGNGGYFSEQFVNSTGISGLTATLSAGNLLNGSGILRINFSGIATTSGTASFVLNFAGRSCTLNRTVIGLPILTTTPASAIFPTTAKTGGNISFNGNATISARGVVVTELPSPSNALLMTNEGAGSGVFVSNLSGLNPNKEYYFRAYATNEAGTSYGSELRFRTANLSIAGNGITDINGYFYPSIILGTQEWMKENLKVTKYRNGDTIMIAQTANEWTNASAGVLFNNEIAGCISCAKENCFNNPCYGNYYNWYAVADPRGLCPSGWHVPSSAEWTTLETYLKSGNNTNVCRIMRSILGGWPLPNDLLSSSVPTNESNFTAVASGRVNSSTFEILQKRYSAYFWTSSAEPGSANAIYRAIGYDSNSLFQSNFDKRNGLSVRCIKD